VVRRGSLSSVGRRRPGDLVQSGSGLVRDWCGIEGLRRRFSWDLAKSADHRAGEKADGGDCVKKMREHHAAREMKAGPSEPSCRGRLQTAISCFGPMAEVVNVMVKRRGMTASCRNQGDERKRTSDEASKTVVDIKTGVFTLLREEHGRNLPTVHAVSGV
jgi:hypothetical protein